MPKNRVEVLEDRVDDLEATVTALTEELVETKGRLESLEDTEPVEIERPEPGVELDRDDIIIC